MRIVHITSVHPRYDIRIFVKECVALAENGHEVVLLVADGKGNEIRRDVAIYDVGSCPESRMARLMHTGRHLLQKALEQQPDVVHLHDPELLLLASRFKRHGCKVVYDAHEDLPRQILNKYWIPALLRPLTSKGVEWLEQTIARHLDAVVAATPVIRQRFTRLGVNAIDVCNYPIVHELIQNTPWEAREENVCYLGSISRTRGIEPIIQALPATKARLNLAGLWSDATLKGSLIHEAGWRQVNDLGVLNRQEVAQVLASSKIGLVTLFPTPSYLEALPIKLFEYMATGLPVIASDFPLWRQIIEQAECGILVDPTRPECIAKAINQLLNDDERMQKMGQAGQRAVMEHYRWESEAKKLIQLYQAWS